MVQKVWQFYIMKKIDVNFLNIVQLIKHFDLHDTCNNEYMKVWLPVIIKKKKQIPNGFRLVRSDLVMYI